MKGRLLKGAIVLVPLVMIAGGIAYFSIPMAFIVTGSIVWLDLKSGNRNRRDTQ